MRDRLIELIEQKQVYGIDQKQEKERDLLLLDNDVLADHLLANGIIVLPCKVGQTVYCDICNEGKGYYDECVIKNIEFDRGCDEPLFTAVCYERGEYQTYWESDFGKTIFLEPHLILMNGKRSKQ